MERANVLYLLRQLVARDIAQRHKGTVAGALWLVMQPLLMLAIYTVVFGLIFKPRWEGVGDVWDYALMLFLGKIPYIFMLETVGRASSLIASHENYVKKVTFPVYLLPVTANCTSALVAMLSLVVWAAFCLLLRGYVPLELVLVPVLYVPMFLSLLGLSYIIAALGAYFRDVGQVVQPIVFSMMFLSPVFYPVELSPAWLRPVFKINPLTFPIEAAREMLLGAGSVRVADWTMQLIVSALVLAVGYWFFARVRPGFADVV